MREATRTCTRARAHTHTHRHTVSGQERETEGGKGEREKERETERERERERDHQANSCMYMNPKHSTWADSGKGTQNLLLTDADAAAASAMLSALQLEDSVQDVGSWE